MSQTKSEFLRDLWGTSLWLIAFFGGVLFLIAFSKLMADEPTQPTYRQEDVDAVLYELKKLDDWSPEISVFKIADAEVRLGNARSTGGLSAKELHAMHQSGAIVIVGRGKLQEWIAKLGPDLEPVDVELKR